MSQNGIIECIVAIGYCVFVADAYCQPVAAVFLDFEGNFARLVAFLLQGRLYKAEVVVITFG